MDSPPSEKRCEVRLHFWELFVTYLSYYMPDGSRKDAKEKEMLVQRQQQCSASVLLLTVYVHIQDI